MNDHSSGEARVMNLSKHALVIAVLFAASAGLTKPAIAGPCDGNVLQWQIPFVTWTFVGPPNQNTIQVAWLYKGECHDLFHMIVVANGQNGPQNEYNGDGWPCVSRALVGGGEQYTCASPSFPIDPKTNYLFEVQGCMTPFAQPSECTAWGVGRKLVNAPPPPTPTPPPAPAPQPAPSCRIKFTCPAPTNTQPDYVVQCDQQVAFYEQKPVGTQTSTTFVGGDENTRLDDASRLSGWDNVQWIGIDARVACASFCR
jgi:hypothetical protein